jgi:mannose-6-phosphate isomerase
LSGASTIENAAAVDMAKPGIFRKSPPIQASGPEESVFAALSPFRIEPKFVERVWGFRDLRPWFDYIVGETEGSSGQPIGEVWLTGDECRVATGRHTGKTLAALFAEQPEALLGKDVPSGGSPLLIKIIFAREKLSVQVHPDDAMAQRLGQPRGKTECWYALSADHGARVAVGLKPGVSQDEVRLGIREGTLENNLQVLPVAAEDMIYVDAGTVHAIWPGSILLETQQNSDVTYRMYDYGRPRELHVEKSLEAMKLATRAGKVAPRVLGDRTILLDESYFRIERIPVRFSRSSTTLIATSELAPGLAYLFAAAGAARLTSPSFGEIDLPTRGMVAIPAASPVFAVQDLGDLDLIRISPRWPN